MTRDPLTVYVSGTLDASAAASEIARDLRSWGYLVTSQWHDLGHTAEGEGRLTDEQQRAICLLNFEHMEAASSLVFWHTALTPRVGRFIELGVFLGREADDPIFFLDNAVPVPLMARHPKVHLLGALDQLEEVMRTRRTRRAPPSLR